MEDEKKTWCVTNRSAGWLPKGCAEVVERGLAEEEAKARAREGSGLRAAPEPDEAMAAVVEEGRAWVSDPVPMDRLEPGQPPIEARRDGEEPREAVPGSDGFHVAARIRRRWIAPLVAAAVVAVLALCIAGIAWVSQPSEPAPQEIAAAEVDAETEEDEDDGADEESADGDADAGSDEEAADDEGDASGAADAPASGSDAGGGSSQAASSGSASQGGGSSQPSAPAADPTPAPEPEPEPEPVAPSCSHNWVENTAPVVHEVCGVCGAIVDGNSGAHLKAHAMAGEAGPNGIRNVYTQTFYEPTGTYYCTICGATR